MAYFNYERKLLTIQDMKTIIQCAKDAGVYDHLFVSFGLLLGICREHNFIKHDNDVDMCLLADNITKEQEDDYFDALKGEGMFQAREEVARRRDTGRMTWFSLRRRADHSKFCHWLCFRWGGYVWHTKSKRWIKTSKFGRSEIKYREEDDAILQGTPENYVLPLQKCDFKDMVISIPARPGSVLDWCYQGWYMPKSGGSSAHRALCRVPKWSDPSGWVVTVQTP